LEHHVTTAWYWEGNVVDAIARFLVEHNWTIISKANTHTKERGVDLHAIRTGKELLVEVKGFPSTQYRDPQRANERKSTKPTTQAHHWYSHALLKVVRLQTKYPDAIVALGFPDFPRYRSLFEETRIGLRKLNVAYLTVDKDGSVGTWGLENDPPL
jgi:Holliday junction resolvase-like predicted endonuclease